MAGVILETLSTRKLVAFGVILLLMQFIFFLVGGLVGKYSCTVVSLGLQWHAFPLMLALLILILLFSLVREVHFIGAYSVSWFLGI